MRHLVLKDQKVSNERKHTRIPTEKRDCFDLREDYNIYYFKMEILQYKSLNIHLLFMAFPFLGIKNVSTHEKRKCLIRFNAALFTLPKAEENLK